MRSLGCFDSTFSMPVQRVAFIGESKSGKTSLIDTLLGYDVLPRDTKTMQNIEIRLTHSPELQSPTFEIEEGSNQFKRFTSSLEAKNALREMQQKATVAELSEKVKFTLSSNQSADMSIIDTVAIDEQNTLSLEVVKRAITDTDVLIVLVMNANLLQDENKHIRDKWFKLIKEVDYDLSRTICVFTHCDRLPSNFNYGSKIKPFLKENNDELNLKYGFICCKANFSSAMSASDVSHFEKEYFNSHKVFQFMSLNDYFTVDTLGERITKFICDSYQFKKNMCYLFQQLKDRIAFNERELSKFGSDYIEFTSQSKDLYMQSLMNLFCETVDKTFSGKAEFEQDNVANTNLKKQYVEFLEPYLNVHPSKTAKNENIIKIIQQTEGAQIGGFPTGDVVYSLLDESIEILRTEIKAYLDNIYLIVNNLIKDLIARIFGRFPKALDSIEELILGFLEQEFNKTKKIILNIAEMNFNYLYIDEMSTSYQNLLKTTLLKNMPSNNPQMRGANGEPLPQGQNQQGMNNNNNMNRNNNNNQGNNNNNPNNMNNQQMGYPMRKEEKDISFFKTRKDKDSYYKSLADYVKALIDYIYSEMIRNLREYLPKATGNFYIKSLKSNMRFYLLAYLSKNPQFVENLEEDQEQAEKRGYYIETTKTLKKISKQISYDDSLMKIIKGDNIKSIDNIVNAQFKSDGANRTKPSETTPSTTPTNTSTTTQPAPAKKSTNWLFGSSSSSSNTNTNPPKNTTTTTNPPPQTKPAPAKGMAALFGTSKPQTTTHSQTPTQTHQKTNSSMGSFLGQQSQPPTNPQSVKPQQSPQPQHPQKGLDVNFKFDPTTNQVKDVKLSGEIDYKTAKAIYDNNKQYLPTGAQMLAGAKSAYSFTSKIAEEANKDGSGQPKKNNDPLSSLFGTGPKKGGNSGNKGMF